ncbi:MAG: MBL fold metallo-hydrolase [Pseudomonadota bacterium]
MVDLRALFVTLATVMAVHPATAQERRPSHCIALADRTPGAVYLHKASWTEPVEEFTVRINYIDHATFLLQTEGGLTAATDFTGFLGVVDLVPDVVTMNNAHETHWTSIPDPRIPHVLQGWAQDGVAADHSLDLDEMLVRNVPTDIRSRFGPGRENDGNSIFIFEVAGLCIGHLGHLHHEPSDAQYAAIGRLDVVMAAVDGGISLDTPTMLRVLKRLRASIVLPMHWFSISSLEEFLVGMSEDYAVVRSDESSIEVNLRSLPERPTIYLLRTSFLRDPE